MHIRRLSSDDTHDFLALRTLALTREPERFRTSSADDEKLSVGFWRNRLDTDRVYGVEDQGKLIGIGGLGRFVGEKLQHKGLIWGMFISPEARGTQASHLLMEALIESARGFVSHLQLTLMANNLRARAYYERHGFMLYAIEPQSVMTLEGPADEALMWRLVDTTTE
jgi:ribosomal protein S18 acetylase RimI-like enzyme